MIPDNRVQTAVDFLVDLLWSSFFTHKSIFYNRYIEAFSANFGIIICKACSNIYYFPLENGKFQIFIAEHKHKLSTSGIPALFQIAVD